MSQISRKWIEDHAINSDKFDSSDSYSMVNLHTTNDATIGNSLLVDGTSYLSDTTIAGDASVTGYLSVDMPTQLNSTLTVANKSYLLNDVTVGGNLSVAASVSFSGLTVTGDAYIGGDSSFAGDTTMSGGLSVQGRTTTTSLAAPSIVGDSTVSGGLSVTNRTTTTSLAAPSIVGDSTVSGGLSVTNRTTTTSLTAPSIVGDSTVSGGLSVTNRTTTTSLAAPSIVGDSTVSGGLSVTNRTTTTSLAAPSIVGDSTVSGGLSVTNRTTTTSLVAPSIVGDSTISGGGRINSTLTVAGTAIIGGTGSPGAALDVASASDADVLIGSYPPSSTYNVISMNGILTEGNMSGFLGGGGGAGQRDLYIQSGNAGEIHIRTGNGSAYSEKMLITNSGDTTVTGGLRTTATLSANTVSTTNLTLNGDVTTSYGFRVNGTLTGTIISGTSTMYVPNVYAAVGYAGILLQSDVTCATNLSTPKISGPIGPSQVIQMIGDSTISGGFKINGALTAHMLLGDTTVYFGGFEAANRITGYELAVPSSGAVYACTIKPSPFSSTVDLTSSAGIGINTASSLTLGTNWGAGGDINLNLGSGGSRVTTFNTGAGQISINPLYTIFPNKSKISYNGPYLEIHTNGTYGDDGNIEVYGDLYTLPLQEWVVGSSNPVGFSVISIYIMYWKKVGRLIHLWFEVGGTSDSTDFTFDLPITPHSSGPTAAFFTLPFLGDNGAALTTPGVAVMQSGTTTIALYPTCDIFSASWTASGDKWASGYICYDCDWPGP